MREHVNTQQAGHRKRKQAACVFKQPTPSRENELEVPETFHPEAHPQQHIFLSEDVHLKHLIVLSRRQVVKTQEATRDFSHANHLPRDSS